MESPSITHAGGVVWRRRGGGVRFLLVRPAGTPASVAAEVGEWVLPKGHVEPGEAVEEAALREVLEEAGAVAELGPLCGIVEYDAGQEYVRCAFFAMELRAQAESGEGRGMLWATLEEVRERVPFPDTVAVVEQAAQVIPESA